MEESIQPPNCGEVPVFALGNIKSGDPDRGQAEHVILPFLCLCLAGGSKNGERRKASPKPCAGPYREVMDRGTDSVPNRKLHQTGSSVASEAMSPTSDEVLPECRAVSHHLFPYFPQHLVQSPTNISKCRNTEMCKM